MPKEISNLEYAVNWSIFGSKRIDKKFASRYPRPWVREQAVQEEKDERHTRQMDSVMRERMDDMCDIEMLLAIDDEMLRYARS